jgi:hypothetical protein
VETTTTPNGDGTYTLRIEGAEGKRYVITGITIQEEV